jgi:G:T-mismatch repair DNA endonuclease (very short patch repair protein)
MKNYSHNNHCTCGKLIQDTSKHCSVCAKIGNIAPNYKKGLPKCIDCGKEVSNYNNKRCAKCNYIYYSGEKHPNYIESAHSNCIDCGKELKNYYAKRCSKHAQIKLWKNIKHKEKMVLLSRRGMHLKPNKPETVLGNLLNILFPKQYKFVGDGKVILAGFNPDFINCNGQKKIIEVYGDYWHNLDSYKKRDKRRLIEYKKLGYSTLIIWGKELKDLEKTANKLQEFHYGNI